MVAALKSWGEEEINPVKKQAKKVKVSPKKKWVQRVYINASIVLSQEEKAVIALASRGRGRETGSRVIEKMRVDEEGLYGVF